MLSMVDILPYILSSLHEPQGPFHCWLNSKLDENLFKADGIFLVLIDEYLEHSLEANQNSLKMFEKAKFLQQRYPSLQVVALQYGKSINLSDIPMHLHQRIIKEYYVFPILLSRKIFEVENLPCHIISKGFQNPIVFSGVDVDLKVLDKAIHDLNAEDYKEPEDEDLKSPWVKRIEVFKEPDICSASRNLLFPFPGCISVDESGERVFLSDVNQHRIVVSDSNGKILDVIGSSPGFVDGEFDIAKLMRPAASFFDVSTDCLYFVDSENHAIRRADMERRIVETVFPVPEEPEKKKGLWGQIVDEIWMNYTKPKTEEFNSDLLLFPWHLLKASNDDLYVLNQSFRTLWIIDLGSGQIREVVKESSKILELCGPMILEKCVPLSYLPSDLLEQQGNTNCLFEGLPYADLMSSVATCEDHIIFCNAVGQRVVKLDKRTGSASNLQFSNFGILGLPFWLVPSSPESYYAVHVLSGVGIDRSETHCLFPGKVDIELIVDIPQDTELVEHPQEGSLWRQARGAAAEVTGAENIAETTQRVGVAQQWYDEMESFLTPHLEELSDPEEAAADETPIEEELPEGRVRIECTVNTSLGTSETIIYAALYLRLKKNSNNMDSRGKKAARMADVIDPKGKFNKDLLIKALMMSDRDLEELVFVRPLHVRLKFNAPEHAKIGKTKHGRLVDTSLTVHVAL